MSSHWDSVLTKVKDFYKSQSNWQLAEHAFCALATYKFASYLLNTNWKNAVLSKLNSLPITEQLIENQIEEEAKKSVLELVEKKKKPGVEIVFDELPKEALPHDKIIEILNSMRTNDIDPKNGKSWALVYSVDKEGHHELVNKVHGMFLETNALNPMAFNSLRKMEVEIVRMSRHLMHGDKDTVGSVTTGGTESILCAIKSYRDRARKLNPHIKTPEMIVSRSVHPAFLKAASYFDVKPIVLEMDKDLNFDLAALKASINSNTILVVGSAPQYPHGMVDPIEEIAKIVLQYNIPLHVDSCIGGFVLPFAEQLGYKIPTFDFRVEGVTSISMDCHKYGYSSKGVSVILYKSKDIRKYQYFAYSIWPGGLFVSPSMPGTRGGGPIASAYASMLALGLDGYLEQTKLIMKACDYFKEEISKIEDLEILGKPNSSLISFKSTNPKVNIFSVADALEEKGWKMEAQRLPDSIHCTVFPIHYKIRETFIQSLKEAVETVKSNPKKFMKDGVTGMYGTVTTVGEEKTLDKFLISFMSNVYQ